MAELRDMVLGAAVGDALGVPFEFRARGTFRCEGMVGGGIHGQPRGTWSDDTSLILATCDSLFANWGRVNVADMRMRFNQWLYRAKYSCGNRVFDCGYTVRRALEEGHGMGGEDECGNGSLMRILPLAFTDATRSEVREVSAITHANPVCTEACVEMVRLARLLICGASPRLVVSSSDYSHVLDMDRDEVRSGGYVLDTMEAALWCLVNTDSYSECVLEAVNLGDDTDTTACVAGGLAGIVYGSWSIPDEWYEALRFRRRIADNCREWPRYPFGGR